MRGRIRALAAAGFAAVLISGCGQVESLLAGQDDGDAAESEVVEEVATDVTDQQEEAPSEATEQGGEDAAEESADDNDDRGTVVFAGETFYYDRTGCTEIVGHTAMYTSFYPAASMRAVGDGDGGIELRIDVHPEETEMWTVSFDTGRGDTATFERYRTTFDHDLLEGQFEARPYEGTSGTLLVLPDGRGGMEVHPDGALLQFDFSC